MKELFVGYKHERANWKEFLPSVFSWLEKVKGKSQTALDLGAAYVVPFEKKEGKEATALFHWGAFSDESFKTEAQSSFKALSPEFSRTAVCLVRGAAVIFVSVTPLLVEPCQKGRQLGIDAAEAVKGLKRDRVVLCEGGDISGLDVFDGLFQAWYNLIAFRKKPEVKDVFPSEIGFCGKAFSEETFRDLCCFLKASCITRTIADAPPNWMNPERFADIAEDIAKELGLKCTILGREEILAEGMGSFHSVAQGSFLDPKFIALEVKGKDTSRCVSLVGKGLTFDSGGINIKPSAGIAEMKYDMCGGAAVLGAAYYLGQVTPPTNVMCVIGAVENMPGAYATRPSDIVKSRSGKTIEILNTDAEGRLVLADLLDYVKEEYKPEFVIDVATLTGAVGIALGTVGAAILSNKQEFCDYVLKCSKKSGEPFWQLPIWPELDRELKSEIADLQNITGASVKAGTLTAAAFLRQFVGDMTWAHLDIASTGNACRATGFATKGASGFSLRTMVSACLNWKG